LTRLPANGIRCHDELGPDEPEPNRYGVHKVVDLAAGAGPENAAGAGQGIAGFGAVSAGGSRYHTGSHVDTEGPSLLTGFPSARELPPGFLTLGAFFEFGSGFYDTCNSFGNAAAVRGNGEMEYFGGGALGRMDFSRTGPGHFHAEASARLGRMTMGHDGTDLRDYRGRAASYSSKSAYYGLHAGLGYLWETTDETTFDLSHDGGAGAYAPHYESARNSLYPPARRGDTGEHGSFYFTQDPERNRFLAPTDRLDRNSPGLAAGFGYRLGDSADLTLKYSRLPGSGDVKALPIKV
jgi:hypothetical protein